MPMLASPWYHTLLGPAVLQKLSALVTEAMRDAHSKSVEVSKS